MKISKINQFYIIFRVFIIIFALFILFSQIFLLSSCKNKNSLKTIKLYNIETNKIETLNFEDYIAGVVQSEISESTPDEALKVQAVISRTFALNFIKNNKSKYEGADISNDISEAQVYKKCSSTKIKNAVKKTKNLVIKCKNEYINPLFYANSGGITATPNEGLNLENENYSYIKSVKSPETQENSTNFSWTYTFSKNEILNATRNMGISLSSISSFEIGETGESGRCKTFIIGGKEIDANTFRLNIGSTKMKSTFIEKIAKNDSNFTFYGKGFGHGVGLSQEGSIIFANQGMNFKDIISYYFYNVKIINE